MLNQFWYGRHPLRWMLWPASLLFACISRIRRVYLERFKQRIFDVPIIVVGNISVGGVGKTPLVIALAEDFRAKGLRVGIVSRGYGARGIFPREVQLEDNANEVGDEPLLLRRKTECPVVIAPQRVAAVDYLLHHHQPDVILSDDGLQHYAMGRAIEIAVIDGMRGLGNGLMLPAGPLREGARRLKSVDFIVVNGRGSDSVQCLSSHPLIRPVGHLLPEGEGILSKLWRLAFSPREKVPDRADEGIKSPTLIYHMSMVPGDIKNLLSHQVIQPSELTQPIAAVAAIGNPQRFHRTLLDLNIAYNPYSFADHYAFKSQDLKFKETNIVMTEKDAVKCLPFATENMYVLSVTAQLDHQFWDELWAHQQLKGVLST